MPKLHPEEALQSLVGTDYRKALQKDAQSFLGSVGPELVKLLLQADWDIPKKRSLMLRPFPFLPTTNSTGRT